MFQFSAFALHPYAFRVKYPCGWVAPFGNPGITVRLPTPPGLSQVPTSFIASRHQDIHHVPLSLGHANRTPRRAPRSFDPIATRDTKPTSPRSAPRSRIVRRPMPAPLAWERPSGPPKAHTTSRTTRPFENRSDSPGLAIIARCKSLLLQSHCSFSCPPTGDPCRALTGLRITGLRRESPSSAGLAETVRGTCSSVSGCQRVRRSGDGSGCPDPLSPAFHPRAFPLAGLKSVH